MRPPGLSSSGGSSLATLVSKYATWRTAGGTCGLLLAAAGRRADHAGAFWQHAENDRGAATAERVANQERQRIERSRVIQRGEVFVERLVGSGKQTRPVSGTAQRAEDGHLLKWGHVRVLFALSGPRSAFRILKLGRE
jgi:hypothetical protein